MVFFIILIALFYFVPETNGEVSLIKGKLEPNGSIFLSLVTNINNSYILSLESIINNLFTSIFIY
ncbi:MAG: hypothetical protein RAM36_00865, partial [Arsenophonus sp.]|nr:hypothetical protein [Arsenophonus sp.]